MCLANSCPDPEVPGKPQPSLPRFLAYLGRISWGKERSTSRVR